MVRLAKKKKRQKRFQKKLHPTSHDIFKSAKKLVSEPNQEGPQQRVLQDWVQAEQIVKEQLRRNAQENL